MPGRDRRRKSLTVCPYCQSDVPLSPPPEAEGALAWVVGSRPGGAAHCACGATLHRLDSFPGGAYPTDMETAELKTTDTGYLVDFNAWTEVWAADRADCDMLRLGDRHWGVIKTIRAFVELHRRSPMTLELLQQLGVNLKMLHQLFPLGSRQACKLAGAPAPGCVAEMHLEETAG